ncbi:uncharacterized protein Bfra_002793 [Botrytis fragariae]|uniref:Uncharacterized protein n=1 Tax=Botrytis fragariae TaxID=1964551 RepID=A0A8H6ELC8_9HELO|nr:uncharacterized protein Bfra_002793 [Botrytis fragariae]KAF5876389.1 hypothetical protein Bfra_002793 [Botrytis fragariae]
MPFKPFFPFNQDHPTFPAEFRSQQKDFSSRDAARGANPILQDDRMNHSFIFEKGCRIAFSGFFRHGSKDFCLVENMNPDLLTEIFFEIKHSSNPSEHADITAAVCGIRDSTKFFFVSCNYHDPEHITIRTYAKFRNFDWNDQSQIDDLNLFRMAAIAEGCGIIAFAEDGQILPPSEMRSTIEVTPEEQSSKEQRASTIAESSFDDMQNDTRVSNSSDAKIHVTASTPVLSGAQNLQAHPSAPKFQFRPTAPQFQPVTTKFQVNSRQPHFNAGPLESDRVRGAPGVGQGLQSLIRPGGHVQQPPAQHDRSNETLHQFNQRQVDNQGQNPGSGMQQRREKVASPHYSQQIVTQFQGQEFGMRKLPIHHGSDTFHAQEYGTLPQQTQQIYGHMPQYTTLQNYTPPQDQRYNFQQQHHRQSFKQFQAQGDVMDQWYNQKTPLQFQNQVCGMYQQYDQGQQKLEQPQLHGPHAPRQYVQQDQNDFQNLVASQQIAQRNPVQIQIERHGGAQQSRQGYYHFENLTTAEFQQYEKNRNNSQDSNPQKVQSAPEQNNLDPPEFKHPSPDTGAGAGAGAEVGYQSALSSIFKWGLSNDFVGTRMSVEKY